MICVTGSFDNLHAREVRFLEEASRLGPIHLLLYSDALVETFTGRPPLFPQAERLYYLRAIRYVDQVTLLEQAASPHTPPWPEGERPSAWVIAESEDHPEKRAWGARHGVPLHILSESQLEGFLPAPEIDTARRPDRKKVIVTGCYDWLHSGHVRFFEEASAYGELYVAVGNDANVRNLKGEGHPLFPQELRRYMVGAIRYVHQALITSGWGWLDAEPEIERLKPDIYLVNEDGDKPEKRAYCEAHGLEYVVLRRLPAPGLQRRSSTDLRGF